MNFWLETVEVLIVPVAISALFIGGYVYMADLWQRRIQRRRAMHAAFHVDKDPHK